MSELTLHTVPPEVVERLRSAMSDRIESEMVDLTTALVDVPSVTGEEGPAGDVLAERLEAAGLDVTLQEVEAGRNNVIATSGGPADTTVLMLGHLDTSTEPDPDLPYGFQPRSAVEGRWIAGLGVSNMKCAFGAFLGALRLIDAAGVEPAGRIKVAGVVGEIEKAPVDEWQGQRYRGSGIGARVMLNRGVTADFCINGEPTGLRLQNGNAGYVFARLRIEGRPQHTFSRSAALDPIPKALAIHQALDEWQRGYRERHAHEVMDPLVSVGAIHGGMPFKPSITASSCSLYVHVNLTPDQTVRGVEQELEEFLASQMRDDPDLTASVDIYTASNGHMIPYDHPGAQAMAEAHLEVVGSPVLHPNPERYAVSSDNSPLFEFGIPGITYGAGGINRSGGHTMYEPGVGEVVGIDNLVTCARVYAGALLRLLGTT
jgi:acetylornithine deacetylase/succinyl-diaminopimelate desuccinylase-like protein